MNDFIVSIHALERFEERFPDLWTTDEEIGQLIYRETIEALDAGRVSSIAPLELASYDLTRWHPGDARYSWNQEKTRGYVLLDVDGDLTVATVLVGLTTEEARSRMYGTKPRAS